MISLCVAKVLKNGINAKLFSQYNQNNARKLAHVDFYSYICGQLCIMEWKQIIMAAMLGMCLILFTGVFVMTALYLDDKRKNRHASVSE